MSENNNNKKKFGWIFWTILGLVLIQFVPVIRNNPPVVSSNNFVNAVNTPKNVENLLKNSCYDCHSNQTVYTWYSHVAPISWTIRWHVRDGRKNLNFSEWTKYNADQKDKLLENSILTLKDQTMPHKGYVVFHENAKLSNKERKFLIDYFEKLRSKKL